MGFLITTPHLLRREVEPYFYNCYRKYAVIDTGGRAAGLPALYTFNMAVGVLLLTGSGEGCIVLLYNHTR